MNRTLTPQGPDFEGPDGRLYSDPPYNVIAYGLTDDGREIVILLRWFNTLLTIGPVGDCGYADGW